VMMCIMVVVVGTMVDRWLVALRIAAFYVYMDHPGCGGGGLSPPCVLGMYLPSIN
jgi:hypothetical protein